MFSSIIFLAHDLSILSPYCPTNSTHDIFLRMASNHSRPFFIVPNSEMPKASPW